MRLGWSDPILSLSVITDSLGTIVQELSYDPWGQRRVADTWQALSRLSLMTFDSSRTTRGYTGHEMVDAVGIVHMNGRIYDPRLGRFLQADPVIQFPNFSQSWNRYSYVLNNPLAYTDPTGYIIPIFTAFAAAIIAAGVVEGVVVAAALIGAGVFADSLAQGVPLGKAFLAGVSAAALTAVSLGTFPTGNFGLNLATFQHVATVATFGGITTSLQGGKFGHGFLSAGLGSASGGIPVLGKTAAARIATRTVVSAVTAGTISEITGGKFANGAVTAAFVALVASTAQRASMPDFSKMTKVQQVAWIQENADRFGLDFSNVDNINLGNIDDHVARVLSDGSLVTCDGPCSSNEIYADFNTKTRELRLFAGAFRGGGRNLITSLQFDGYGEIGRTYTYVTYTDVEQLVHTFGHELAHSHGIDVGGRSLIHPNAERTGLEAVKRFRGL